MTAASPGRAADSRPVLRLGTRRSALALTQSTWVADRIRALGHPVELVEIVTEGDVNTAPLAQIGGTGVFASALRAALHRGDVDLAVHSLKDLPSADEPGLVIAAIPPREDPRDALIARDGLTLAGLPAGAVVGTGSPRRAAQLLAVRPDLRITDLRGNVPTRLRAVREGRCDAVVLAAAGLRRLDLADAVTDFLGFDLMLPAAGQGALAVECRSDDAGLRAILAPLDDPGTRATVGAERAFLRRMEAGCTAPIGVLGTLTAGRTRGHESERVSESADRPQGQAQGGGGLTLWAFVGFPDRPGGLRRTLTSEPASAEHLGSTLAGSMLAE